MNQESEIRGKLGELDAQIQTIKEGAAAAEGRGDGVAVVDAEAKLRALREERERLERALKIAMNARYRAEEEKRMAAIQREITAARLVLDSVFGAPWPELQGLKDALSAFDPEAFKRAAGERLRSTELCVATLQAHERDGAAPWSWGDVKELIERLVLARAKLNQFVGG